MSSSSDSEAAPDGTSGSSGGEGASANPEDCRRCWWPGGPLAAAALAAQLCVLAFPLCLAEEARYERFLDYNELGHLPRARTRVYWRSTDLGCYLREAGALVTGTVFFTFEYFRIKRKKRWSGSMFAAHSRAYFLSVWVALNLQALRDTWFLFMPCAHCIVVPPSVQLRSVASECVDIVTLCAAFLFYGLVEDRLRLVEVGFNARLGSNMIRGLRYALLVIMLMGVTNGNFDLFHLVGNAPYWASGYLITAMIPLLASAVTFRAITVVRRPTLQETPGLSAYTQAEKVWACNALASVRRALSLPLLTSAVCFLAEAVSFSDPAFSEQYWLLMDAVRVLVTALVEAVSLFFVIGVFTEQRPAFEAEGGGVKEVLAARRSAGSEAWNAKVSALAGRSVSALSLLDFFERLGPNGETMPHFDPRRSTTGDVVRHAVVPLSRRGDAGLPYAELVRSGGAALPASMVTHTWGCCFAVLVAAVVADAMGLAEYGDVLAQLEEGRISRVRDRLDACGGLQQTYWICAFCVNQHAGICGGFGPPPLEGTEAHRRWEAGRRDKVTGNVYPVCRCRQPKFFNEAPEECEMNKFDDMMAELSERVEDFQQVVVVDPGFTIFTRAWCVAELVQASVSGIRQEVKLLTRRGIDLYSEDMTLYRSLARLTVKRCEASRQEDKDEIMSRILDVERFDSHVQDMIFGDAGLMRKAFTGFGLLDAAVRTSRRISALQEADMEDASHSDDALV